MEELLYEILTNLLDIKEKLNQCLILLSLIDEHTVKSTENTALEIANNVIGDIIANAISKK